jgi:hypothetical protein
VQDRSTRDLMSDKRPEALPGHPTLLAPPLERAGAVPDDLGPKALQTIDAKLSHPAVRLRDFHPSHRLWLVGPAQQLFPYRGPVLLQVARELSDFHAVDPRTSFVRLDSLVSLPAVSPLADFFCS